LRGDEGAAGLYLIAMSIAARLADLKDDFSFLDSWEERYRHIIELGRALPDLSEAERIDANKVKGCASQVWIVAGREGAPPVLRLRGDSDAHIVRGLVAIMLTLYDGAAAAEVAALPPEQAFADLGIADALSAQRSNGLKAMAARIRAEAEALPV
jgi:cysteine desulfuration protein SufE